MKVLLVDDDAAIQKLVRAVLETRNHEVFTLDTPYGVSAAILRHLPDVALLDVRMPGLSGPQLAQLIVELPLASPPQLALYSSLDNDALRDIEKETRLPCISKTIGVHSIVDAIEALHKNGTIPLAMRQRRRTPAPSF
jgi:CheY-like chemotaxis protein